MAEVPDNSALLAKILTAVCQIQSDNKALAASVDAINGRVNALADVKKLKDAAKVDTPLRLATPASKPVDAPFSPTTEAKDEDPTASKRPPTSRIILTTYPGQSGINPIIMNWGHEDPMQRGPVVVSRAGSTVRRRNGQSNPIPTCIFILFFSYFLLLMFLCKFYLLLVIIFGILFSY